MTTPNSFKDLNDGLYLLRGKKSKSLIDVALFEIKNGKLLITNSPFPESAAFIIRGGGWKLAPVDDLHNEYDWIISPSEKSQLFVRNSIFQKLV